MIHSFLQVCILKYLVIASSVSNLYVIPRDRIFNMTQILRILFSDLEFETSDCYLKNKINTRNFSVLELKISVKYLKNGFTDNVID